MRTNKRIYLIILLIFLFTGSSSKNQELSKNINNTKIMEINYCIDDIQNKTQQLDSLLIEINKLR